ncbi:hypothetical protein JHK85_023267 [Glycine max]|nr:hypothetical protein JHK85_023267 [Glycine max]KAG5026885.1 hypothetical protein JHK86_022799 [Glycine max]
MASFSLHENAPPVILMIHAGAISHAYVGSASVLVGDIDDALDSEKVVEELLSHFVEELLSAEHRVMKIEPHRESEFHIGSVFSAHLIYGSQVNGSVIHAPSEFDAALVAFEIPILTYG